MIGSHRFYSYFVVLTALLIASCAPTESNTPEVQVAKVTAINTLEGDFGQSTLTFRVTSAIEQRVRYQTTNITAASNSDYLSQSGEWLMQPGVVRTVDVTVLGDTQVEADELVGLLLTYSDGSQSRHQGTIINDDRPLVSVADQRLNEGAKGTTVMRFTLKLSQTTLTNFPVRVITEDANQTQITAGVGKDFQPAMANVDYQPADIEVIFPPGSNEATAEVLIVGDTDIETGEAFLLKVFDATDDPATASPLGSAFGLIINDDGPGFNMPQVTLGNAQALEGPANSNNTLTFPVVLTGPNEVDFSIFYQVILPSASKGDFPPADINDLPASAGKFMDIVATGDTLSLTDSLQIPISGDNAYELDEYFELVLTTESGYELARARGVIQNDDIPRFELLNVSQKEGNSGKTDLSFTLTWNEPENLAEEIRLKYRTLDGFSVDDSKATSGLDYDYTTGTVIFQPGDTSKTINVAIVGDTRYEPNEALTLEVTTESGSYVISARGLIVNDDSPKLGVTPTDGTAVKENAGELRFNAVFEQDVTQNTTLYYVIESGSAMARLPGEEGADVTAPSLTGTASYSAGRPDSDNMPITVTVIDDLLVEQTESFTVTFYSSQQDADNQRNPLNQSAVSIIDNDVVLVEFSTSAFRGLEGNVVGAEVALSDVTSIQPNPTLSIYNGILPSEASISLFLLDTGTAESDDYRFTGGDPATITIPAGDYSTATSMVIPGFVIMSDAVLENDETLTLGLNLNTPSSGLELGPKSTLEITIENDDVLQLGFSNTTSLSGSETNPTPLPSLQAMTAVASDYDPTGPGGKALSVSLSLLNPGTTGQAEGEDFTPSLPATLTVSDFPIAVNDILINPAMPSILNDNLIELVENATLQLTAVPDALATVDTSRNSLKYTITSDDQLTVTLAKNIYSYTEGNIPADLADRVGFIITGGIVDQDSPELSFYLAITEGTATAADYNATQPMRITLPTGTYQDSVNPVLPLSSAHFSAVSDGLVEDTETLDISLSTIAAGSENYLLFGTESSTTVRIISTDQLTVSFIESDYQGFENTPAGSKPKVSVTGDADIEVGIAFSILHDPNEAYPAIGTSVSALTVPKQAGTVEYEVTTLSIPGNTANDVNRVTLLGLATSQNRLVSTVSPNSQRYRILNDDALNMTNGSGMTQCFNDTKRVLCEDIPVGSEYLLQDAFLNHSAPAFTSAGSNTDSTNATWTCTQDNRTGLTWAFEAAAPVSRSAIDASAFPASAGTFCSLSNWRLPRLTELYNLFDFSSSATTLINTTIFNTLSTGATDFYWSADSDFSKTPWAMSFNQGELDNTVTNRLLIMVSDEGAAQLQPDATDPVYACDDLDQQLDPALTSDHRFTLLKIGNDATVTDNLTGLTWTTESWNTNASASPLQQVDWGSALDVASNTTYANSSDWRTPTVKELLSLLYFGCDPDGSLLTDLRLPPYFAPLVNIDTALPLMSSTPVAVTATGDPLALWVLTLNPTTPAAVLTRSDPPSSTVSMQQFLVKTTN